MKQSGKYILGLVSLSLVFFVGGSHHGLAFAASSSTTQNTSDSSSTCTPPTTSSTPGVHQPTGSDAWTFTYNCQTGMWDNQYFIYDPTTDQTTPITPVVYTYDSVTGLWDSSQWIYDAATRAFVLTSIDVVQPPAGALTSGGPSTTDTSGSSGSGSSTGSDSSSSSSSTGTGGSTDSDSTTNPGTTGSSSTSQTQNDSGDITLDNLLSDVAGTGGASVDQNTTAGGATSGNADNIANIINMIDSDSSFSGVSPVTFVENLYGNVNGNLLIDPAQLAQALQSNTTADPTSPYDATVNSESSGAINNNINLLSTSGNANVNENTTAGSATSGNADAMANIINMIDSLITSDQSFIGEINIYGNLDGNILLPASFLGSLLASNAPSVTIPSSDLNSSAITAAFNNNENISNQVNANAGSGQADVSDNTSAGSAQSGTASTNVTLFNLTGNQIVGNNVMLVFVNVLGSWIGLLMNAPAGATAAAYGNGITQNTLASQTTVDSTNNDQINNNVNVGANSGDAAVTSNTSAGNATSGNAEAGVNILNIEGSQFDLSGWFGILFINVFGSWDGDFGVATPPPANTTSSNTGGVNNSAKHVLRFIPTNSGGNDLASTTVVGGSVSHAIKLASDQFKKTTFSPKVASTVKSSDRDSVINVVVAGSIVSIGVILFGIERYLSLRSPKNS